jgi:hypothetical protein
MALRRNERLFLVVFSFVFRLAIQFLGPLASVLTRGVYAELTAPTGIFITVDSRRGQVAVLADFQVLVQVGLYVFGFLHYPEQLQLFGVGEIFRIFKGATGDLVLYLPEQALGILHTARVCFHFGEGLPAQNPFVCESDNQSVASFMLADGYSSWER